MKFVVMDKNTGEAADPRELAFKEDWAEGLVWSDIEGFAITQEGLLILCDETGKFVYCPTGRFVILAANSNGEWAYTIPEIPSGSDSADIL